MKISISGPARFRAFQLYPDYDILGTVEIESEPFALLLRDGIYIAVRGQETRELDQGEVSRRLDFCRWGQAMAACHRTVTDAQRAARRRNAELARAARHREPAGLGAGR